MVQDDNIEPREKDASPHRDGGIELRQRDAVAVSEALALPDPLRNVANEPNLGFVAEHGKRTSRYPTLLVRWVKTRRKSKPSD
jgi:hypothetical protein